MGQLKGNIVLGPSSLGYTLAIIFIFWSKEEGDLGHIFLILVLCSLPWGLG